MDVFLPSLPCFYRIALAVTNLQYLYKSSIYCTNTKLKNEKNKKCKLQEKNIIILHRTVESPYWQRSEIQYPNIHQQKKEKRIK